MGYGSAASTALFLIIGLCTVLAIKASRMKLGDD
jgi:trehalose/maltose transport system permease protein